MKKLESARPIIPPAQASIFSCRGLRNAKLMMGYCFSLQQKERYEIELSAAGGASAGIGPAGGVDPRPVQQSG
ncbi:MAG: hypothetical protein ACR5LG_13490 [Sodalis sp. (in: enterobacteria)]|uniref:hypothetical protein n=1 Tax=Sodalis sp. (in: enterobacteria) TaxID=1898979 RepID=UPI003F2A3F55